MAGNSSSSGLSLKSLLSGSAAVVLVNILGLAAGFGLYFLLPKLLSPAEFGLYAFVMSVGIMGAVFVRLGLDGIIIRIIVEAQEQAAPGRIRGAFRWAFLTMLCLWLVTAAAIAAYAFWREQPYMLLAIPVMLGIALTALGTGVMRAFGYKLSVSWPELLGRPGITLAILCLIALAGFGLSLSTALIVHGLVALVLGFGMLWAIFFTMPSDVADAKPEYRSWPWLVMATPVLWNNLVLLGEPQLIVLISGAVLPPEDVGPIALAARMAVLAGIATVGVNFILPPHLTRLYQRKDFRGIERVMRLGGGIMLAPAIPALVLFYFFGEMILGYFGEAYLSAYWPLILFTLARVVMGLFGPSIFLLVMSEYEKDAALTSSVSVGVMVVLGVILTPIWGGMGIAVAVLASALIRSVWNWRIVKRRLGISTFCLARSKVAGPVDAAEG